MREYRQVLQNSPVSGLQGDTVYMAILSGGGGSRLWPVSRKTRPKPFIKLNDGLSIFQHTVLTSLRLGAKGIINVTAAHLEKHLKRDLAEISQTFSDRLNFNCILEPTGKNTAAAIALASLWVARRHSDKEILLIFPSDQIISDHEELSKAITKAVGFAKQGKIVALGIKPTYPATSYGYIEYDNYDVKNFMEKPNFNKAKLCFESGKYLWNSGIFCFRIKTMLEEMATYCPDILAGTTVSFERATTKRNKTLKIDINDFGQIRDDSIDYAIIEKSDKIAVIPCDIGWSDFGNWDAIGKFLPPDHNGNVITSEVIMNKVTNCYIEGRDRIIGAIGLDNLVIVDTPDALLIANKNNTQDVKNIYNYLLKTKHYSHEVSYPNKNKLDSSRSFLLPSVDDVKNKSSDNYTILKDNSNFKIRQIQINKDFASLPLNIDDYYYLIVIDGTALVSYGNQEIVLNTGQSTQTIGHNNYKLSNLSKIPLIVIEIQHKSSSL